MNVAGEGLHRLSLDALVKAAQVSLDFRRIVKRVVGTTEENTKRRGAERQVESVAKG
jgi:hypothetical protein